MKVRRPSAFAAYYTTKQQPAPVDAYGNTGTAEPGTLLFTPPYGKRTKAANQTASRKVIGNNQGMNNFSKNSFSRITNYGVPLKKGSSL